MKISNKLHLCLPLASLEMLFCVEAKNLGLPEARSLTGKLFGVLGRNVVLCLLSAVADIMRPIRQHFFLLKS